MRSEVKAAARVNLIPYGELCGLTDEYCVPNAASGKQLL
jgi:hypothetical protein